MGVMFSSPAMITMLVVGVLFIVIIVGAIAVAVVQTLRGKLRVDYLTMAAEAKERELREKHARKKGKA